LKDRQRVEQRHIIYALASKIAAYSQDDRHYKKKRRKQAEIYVGRPLPIERQTGQQSDDYNKETDKISHLPAK
jgi:hypothetical protein